jgi:hypothetical protein
LALPSWWDNHDKIAFENLTASKVGVDDRQEMTGGFAHTPMDAIAAATETNWRRYGRRNHCYYVAALVAAGDTISKSRTRYQD